MSDLLFSTELPKPVLETIETLKKAGHSAFLVGGCVRDLLRGQTPSDFDVATSAKPEQVKPLFSRVIPTGIDHGTVTVVLRGQHIEVTTFRAEAEYVDGRRPSKVLFHDDIDADLSRRDFTMNAIAYDPFERQLIDPFGGQEDLSNGIVRCVRNPMERFSEDGLRPLRAVRFAAVLNFTLDPSTEQAISATIDVFRKVAQERVHQEFRKLLLCDHSTKGLELLERTGLLAAFFPEAVATSFGAVDVAPKDEIVRLAVLLKSNAKAKDIVTRLRFPNRVADEVLAVALCSPPPALTAADSDWRRWISQAGATRAQGLLSTEVALGTISGAFISRFQNIMQSQPPLTVADLALKGSDVMRILQIAPSPLVGESTRYLLDRVIDDPSRNTVEALTQELLAWPQLPQRGN